MKENKTRQFTPSEMAELLQVTRPNLVQMLQRLLGHDISLDQCCNSLYNKTNYPKLSEEEKQAIYNQLVGAKWGFMPFTPEERPAATGKQYHGMRDEKSL